MQYIRQASIQADATLSQNIVTGPFFKQQTVLLSSLNR